MSSFAPASRQRLYDKWHKGRWGGHQLKLTKEQMEKVCGWGALPRALLWVPETRVRPEVHEFLQMRLTRRHAHFDKLDIFFCFEEDLIQFKLQFL